MPLDERSPGCGQRSGWPPRGPRRGGRMLTAWMNVLPGVASAVAGLPGAPAGAPADQSLVWLL
jgi:hypothetical protein